jgi:hypothetical protein
MCTVKRNILFEDGRPVQSLGAPDLPAQTLALRPKRGDI